MYRIDDIIHIDTSLITCAEYQLFVDDMLAQGKSFQPDHWISYQFPQGQAYEPILGIRPSDAIAFCEWLTQREGKRWRYRVPSQREARAYPLAQIQVQSSGYWILDSSIQPAMIWKNNKSMLDMTFTIDVARDSAVATAFVLDTETGFVINSDFALARYCTYARALALAREKDDRLVNAIENISVRDVTQYRDTEKNFDLILSLARSRIQDYAVVGFDDEIVQVRAHDIDLVCSQDLVVDIDYPKSLSDARNRCLSRSLTNLRNRNRDLAQAYLANLDLIIAGFIDIVLNMLILRLRRIGLYAAFEGIRITKELNRD